MIRVQNDVRIEGIRRTNQGAWAVVGSRPGQSVVPGRSQRVMVLVREFTGQGAKANAIEAAGTNRIVSPCTAHDFGLPLS